MLITISHCQILLISLVLQVCQFHYFDPSNLPEPVFDTHDLEMFHQQEAYNLDDPYASSNMSLLINPRSDNHDDFSGPNLDDHL